MQMNEMPAAAKEAATFVAQSEERTFGLRMSEILFLGTFLVGLGTQCGNVKEWGELLHPHVIVGMVLQTGSILTAWAMGRLKKTGDGRGPE